MILTNEILQQIKNNIKEIEKQLQTDWRYQRKPCKNCEYKIICAGECEKTKDYGA